MNVVALLLASALSQTSPPPAAEAAPPRPAEALTPAPTAAPPPPVTPVTPSASTSSGTSLRPTVGGFIDFQLSSTNRPGPAAAVNTAEFRRARIGVRGDVVPQIGYTVVYDAADTSLKDAYLALRFLPGAELRVGQFKTPFGYEQSESDTKLLWVYNSYVVAALARGRDSRDEGLLLTGKWALLPALSAELAAAGVNGAGPNTKDDLNEKNVWGRGGAALGLGATTVRAGGSYGYGRQVQSLGTDGKFGAVSGALDDTYAYFRTAGADVTVDAPWFFAAAEWIQSSRHVQKFTAPTAVSTTDVGARGWYAGVYGKTPWKLGPVLRVEQYDPNVSAATRGDRNERYTLGAYLDVLPVNARLIVNYELDRSDAAVRTGDRLIAFGQVIF